MATLLGAISVIAFLCGIAALIRPIPKLKVPTRSRALLVIAASLGIALLAEAFGEVASDGDKRATITEDVPSSASPVVANQSDQLPTFANEIDLSKYLSRCDGATEAIFIRECLGKKVVWEMFFVAGMEDPQVIMGIPGDYGVQSLVSFSSPPEWDDHGPRAWTGRRMIIAARIAIPPHIVDPANAATRWIVLEDAHVVADKTDSSEAQPTEEINVQPVEKDTEVASPNAETERKARLASKTKRMAESIAATLREHYKIEPEPLIPDMALCRDDGYCDFMAGDFQLQVYGAGIAEVLTSTQFPHRDYRKMCVAVFSAISGSNIDLSAELIEGAFVKASQSGPIQSKVANTQIEIEPSWDGLLACSFFKYGN
ncbi:hypothetical protein [Parvibaculum sp.]|jgi:hypothetical protein|uniref:hypothetical protein n=1 Tax=Parvibaculum sp. TaxID=2024848 RepID=UPI000C6B3EED|nr:hypothetical protein [Parvibaculum sp.]MAM93841.1 hypothetical protein [Parvibaculum sp.]HAW22105.1 hypothetical protein [Pseudomonas sp.]|tara:strand:+ start:14055 stop:15167 length:1113 start_codon:yes stop_codon:yes gene_type:complete